MKVLLVGGGGREHALAWKLGQSPFVDAIVAAPGNPGIGISARCEPVAADDVPGLVDLARREAVGLVVVGPEAPLVAGLVDALEAHGIAAFGPTAAAARIEGSKAFAKEFMLRHGIPTARALVFDELDPLLAHLESCPIPVVVKASGLAGGKGVVVCQTRGEALDTAVAFLQARTLGDAGDRVVVEEHLRGQEVSLLAFVDGRRVLPLSACRDHKRVGEGDSGPNTGGMGAFSPVPEFTDGLVQDVVQSVFLPAVRGLAAEGSPFRGLLYAGLMLTHSGPRVLEFNARLGDPETQPLMMRLASDVLPLMAAAAAGDLGGRQALFRPDPAVCVVMASAGYPGGARTGDTITGLSDLAQGPTLQVFHSGTQDAGDRLVTAGGRVLGVTAMAQDLVAARRAAYGAVRSIHWQGAQFRRDIGAGA